MSSLALKSAICLAFLLSLACFGRLNFYRDPGSVFYDESRAFGTGYSAHRRAEAQQIIDTYTSANNDLFTDRSDANKSLCIGINSVKRRKTQYLQTTIGSLLHGLTEQERADLYISILIAETDPTRHPTWNEEWVHRAVDDVYTYQVNATQRQHLRHLEETGRYGEKGVFDYTYALQRCYDTGAPYIGMFEDDIVLADGWMVRTLQGVQQIPRADTKQHPWLFMRLFNQERSIGWASRDIGGNSEHWIILGIGLGISLPFLLARKRWKGARKHLDLGTLFVVVVILVPGLVVLFYQSGKASLLPPSPGVFNEPFGCCSQAMIFPRDQVPLLIKSLRAKRQGQVDLMLDEFATSNGLDRYALYPVQAQHIGIDSARNTVKGEAQAIWSMAFEDLDPEVLEKEHRQMVKNYASWWNKI
ncbi:integral membrane [Fusarium albosuccineum]|uniref:Integral membrane n=1 Tax=Fusarium albosuccineum TaxID=1237068 RepID=A0A8H4LL98_9HYPO|nr:integral membrane [Fusarium albosuccineum]